MLISSAAYFVTCSCGKHGHVRLANGTDGPEVASKEAALASLKFPIIKGMITEEELPELRRQIRESSLTENNDDIGLVPHITASVINSARWKETEEMDQLFSSNMTIH